MASPVAAPKFTFHQWLQACLVVAPRFTVPSMVKALSAEQGALHRRCDVIVWSVLIVVGTVPVLRVVDSGQVPE
jgi:hypothetical protein